MSRADFDRYCRKLGRRLASHHNEGDLSLAVERDNQLTAVSYRNNHPAVPAAQLQFVGSVISPVPR